MPLRDVTFEDLQQWVSALSVNGSTRFEGKGLSASRVIQAHQVVSQILRYAVKAKHLPANPADGIELPRKHEVEQRYLTHEQLHRLAIASGRLRTLVLVLGYCGLRFGEATALRVGDVNLSARRIRGQPLGDERDRDGVWSRGRRRITAPAPSRCRSSSLR